MTNIYYFACLDLSILVDLKEIILNIYLIIEKDKVTGFRAKSYEQTGSDDEKIKFLKSRAKHDFESAYKFDAPMSKFGQFMSYRQFSKLERQGMHYRLFEEIFQSFDIPQNPLICVTPYQDGNLIGE